MADGDNAIGLRYGSKHGSDADYWTIWLRGAVADDIGIGIDEGVSVQSPDNNPVLTKVLET